VGLPNTLFLQLYQKKKKDKMMRESEREQSNVVLQHIQLVLNPTAFPNWGIKHSSINSPS